MGRYHGRNINLRCTSITYSRDVSSPVCGISRFVLCALPPKFDSNTDFSTCSGPYSAREESSSDTDANAVLGRGLLRTYQAPCGHVRTRWSARNIVVTLVRVCGSVALMRLPSPWLLRHPYEQNGLPENEVYSTPS